KRDLLDLLRVHDFANDRAVMRGEQLTTTGPIDFDRVIPWWIMAGSHHDSARTFLISHEKGELGRTSIVVEKIDAKPRRNHDARTKLRKMPRLVPRIVCQRAGEFTGVFRFSLAFDVIGKSLSAFTNGSI